MNLPEADDLLKWLLDSDGSVIDDIIEAAMVKESVKKSRQPHVRRVIEEAFLMALQHAHAIKEQQGKE